MNRYHQEESVHVSSRDTRIAGLIPSVCDGLVGQKPESTVGEALQAYDYGSMNTV